MEKTNRCSQFLEGWYVSVFWAKWLLPRENHQWCKPLLSSILISLVTPPPAPPTPTEPATAERAGPQPTAATPGAQKQAGRHPLAKTVQINYGFCKNQLLFLMGFPWLITYEVYSAWSSSYKSTKCRGQKKGRMAKDEQRSQEAFILKGENGNRGKWWAFPLWALRYWGSQEGGNWNSGEAAWVPGPAHRRRSGLLWCHPAGSKVSSAFAATVPVLWAAEKEKNRVFVF